MDITRKRMALTAPDLTASTLPDCRGFLLKLDERAKVWKRRYCVLSDACLFLYIDQDAPDAKGKTGYRNCEMSD